MIREAEVEIERVVSGGEGLGSIGGKKVFIPLSAPGDLVSVGICEESPDYCRGFIREIKRPSAERVEPRCPLYTRCGGCSLQHINYAAQLEIKKRSLFESLERVGKLRPESADFAIESGEPFGYRNRFQFHGTVHGAGLMPRKGSEAIALPACPLAAGPINEFLRGEAEAPAKADIPKGERRIVFGSEAGTFVEGRDRLARALVEGKEFQFSAGGFFQSNLTLLPRLIDRLRDSLSGEELIDLYGGVGSLSYFCAENFRRIFLVEENRDAVAQALANHQGLAQPTALYALRAEAWADLSEAQTRGRSLICDPPRAGLSAKVRKWILNSRPREIAYVSCDTVSLSRDLGELVPEGYGFESLTLLDFYPQTPHMESLAILRDERP
jgi:23S rRNA (uracil1939-C5)-methyltransferase